MNTRNKLLVVALASLVLLAGAVIASQFFGKPAAENQASDFAPTPLAAPELRGDERDTVHTLAEGRAIVSDAGGFSVPVPAGYSWIVCEGYEELLSIAPSEADLAGMCASDAYAPINFYSVEGNVVRVEREAAAYQDDYAIAFADIAGTRAVRTQFVFNDYPLADDEFYRPPAGVTSVAYQFYTEGKTYRAEYLSQPGSTVGLAAFEAMVRSLTLTR